MQTSIDGAHIEGFTNMYISMTMNSLFLAKSFVCEIKYEKYSPKMLYNTKLISENSCSMKMNVPIASSKMGQLTPQYPMVKNLF